MIINYDDIYNKLLEKMLTTGLTEHETRQFNKLQEWLVMHVEIDEGSSRG
jgi:hypothetical protein